MLGALRTKQKVGRQKKGCQGLGTELWDVGGQTMCHLGSSQARASGPSGVVGLGSLVGGGHRFWCHRRESVG